MSEPVLLGVWNEPASWQCEHCLRGLELQPGHPRKDERGYYLIVRHPDSWGWVHPCDFLGRYFRVPIARVLIEQLVGDPNATSNS